ncbi:EF-hand calcium-binding domain-containing protein 5 isoform X2 [Xenopus tropicalis]|uniref:EF-hand calcium-binding domain-containing protein 5 isoform X2 n=1 Tax=Xenopus tropicalis TaxID=8364 RepID=A0A8J1J7A0_XENTR|nr:EF-hand calcium-binding domain-containing protein 5 isoform X2 [Xenopus tropicalis]
MDAESDYSAHTSSLDCSSEKLESNPKNNAIQTQDRGGDWRTIFFDKMQERGLKLQQKTLESLKLQQAQEKKEKKANPPDEQAKDWFSQDKTTVHTRAYLLDKLMPSIVPGLEALLKELEKRKVLEDSSIAFDPIIYLGEQLMRHNPEYVRDLQSNSYVQGLKEVLSDLKEQIFDLEFNRLGQLKEEMREVQHQRAQIESIQSQVKHERREVLAMQFQEWTLDVSGRIPLVLVQSALKSFSEVIANLPLDEKAAYEEELKTVNTMECMLTQEEFVEYVHPFICHFSTDLFQEFLHHLSQCADTFRETIRHDIWRQMFSDLFFACDPGKVGFLDRQRVLALLETFYEKTISETDEWQPRNPRQWPVVELDEMDPTDFWADFQEGVKSLEEQEGSVMAISATTQISTPTEGDYHLIGPMQEQDKLDGIPSTEGSSESHLIGLPFPTKSEAPTAEDIRSSDSYLIDGKPWSGKLLTADLAIKYSSYGDKIQDECNAAASKFTDLHPIMSEINSRGPSCIASAFNDSALNLPQFVQLMETFLGEGAPHSFVEKLVSFIQKEYAETEEEKVALLSKVRQDALLARQKLVLQALFVKWDNDGSGFLGLDEVEALLFKYKEGMETEVMARGREALSSSQSQRSIQRLSAPEFCKYIQGVVRQLPGPDEEVFESLVEYLTSSVERSQAEKLRGASRRKWLQQIQVAAETSGGNLQPVYKALFQALFKDAEAHGNNKRISANIGLLEESSVGGGWTQIIRYVACTADDTPYVLNKTLQRDMKGVSFAAVESGIPQHVPRVQYHGHIHFWNTDRPEEERKGSLIVLPLIDMQQRAFGTLSIDTMRDPRERNIFLTHEISFYQGVTNAFSASYNHVQQIKDILQLISSALAWIYSRAPNIRSITTYLMEPSVDKGYVFRKMMSTDNNTGLSEIYSSPAMLRRQDNLFRDYLFKCADSSEVITTDAYGERHIAVPIRNSAGRALGVLDLSTGQCKELPAHEYQDLQKMLQMLQEACYEILEENQFSDTQKKSILEAERVSGHRRAAVLFHRFMLQDLRQCVSKLDHQSFAELKSYKEPPTMVHSILKAVLLLFCPDWAESDEVESWNQCKLKVNSDLIRKILFFDPTAQSVQIKPEMLAKYIKGIPRGAVWKHGSIPAEHLYNWAFTCLSLMELTEKIPNTQSPSLITVPVPNRSENA